MIERRTLLAVAAASALSYPAHAQQSHPVLVWTRLLDNLMSGAAATRGRAAMHLAMHDTLNACLPVYARAQPPAADEPAPGRAAEAPALAMAAAATAVLDYLHPNGAAEAAPILASARRGMAPSTFKAAQELGRAVARGFTMRIDDEPTSLLLMEGTYRRGRWRPAPPSMAPTALALFPSFLTPWRLALLEQGPPALDSAAFQQDLYEVRQLGDVASTRRTAAQTEAARYWVGRDLAASAASTAARFMLSRPAGLHADARAMALLSAGLADSSMAWTQAKRHFDFWRPVTAIREAGATPAERAWLPLLGTPPHPDYPSGHAADITTSEVLMDALFRPLPAGILYQGLGQDGLREREFPNMAAAAEECRQSRLWAGAHYRFANDAGQRLGTAIARETLTHLPPLRAQPA